MRVVARSWLAALGGSGLLAGAAAAQVPEGAALGTQEDHPTRTLPEPPPHWVYILEPVFPYLVASKVWILDGDTLEFEGMASAGYTANLVLSHDRSAFYVAETYWIAGTPRRPHRRGHHLRHAHPQPHAARSLLPEGRFLVVPKKHNAQLTTDGRYLLSFNMDPGFGLSVVDVKENRYVGEIETGGCSLAFPTGPASTASMCPDGAFAHVTFDAQGKAEIEYSEPFFDSENDPVFEHAATAPPGGRRLLRLLRGLGLSGDAEGHAQGRRALAAPGRGRGAGWRPGGWQNAAYHAPSNRLFVLMHEGGIWTHKQAGEEVWVFDADQPRAASSGCRSSTTRTR